ncbi:MAG: hypothetical protein DRI83_12860, partial [Bacteroidetes bacterium]
MGYPGPSDHSEEKLSFNIAKPHKGKPGDQELLNLNASTLQSNACFVANSRMMIIFVKKKEMADSLFEFQPAESFPEGITNIEL